MYGVENKGEAAIRLYLYTRDKNFTFWKEMYLFKFGLNNHIERNNEK